jgi:hypothetical protein
MASQSASNRFGKQFKKMLGIFIITPVPERSLPINIPVAPFSNTGDLNGHAIGRW